MIQKLLKAADGTKDVEIMVPLKYLSNSWRTFGVPLINCEINLILISSEKCTLSNDKKAASLSITDTKLYVPIVTFATLLQNYCKTIATIKIRF